jgi:hypothetical protein
MDAMIYPFYEQYGVRTPHCRSLSEKAFGGIWASRLSQAHVIIIHHVIGVKSSIFDGIEYGNRENYKY